jgi:hypothetical protein
MDNHIKMGSCTQLSMEFSLSIQESAAQREQCKRWALSGRPTQRKYPNALPLLLRGRRNTIEHTAVQASQDERPSDSMSVCPHAKLFATVPLSFKISFETQSARSGKIEKKEKPA